MYKKVSGLARLVPREKEVLEFWKANGIFEKSVEQSKGKPAYTFYDGPPTANGRPAYRACFDPLHEGYHSPLPHDERL